MVPPPWPPISARPFWIRTGNTATASKPASPIFDATFSAFAHGTLISTAQGQIAVQDLEPGIKISTETCGPMQLLWIDAKTLLPRARGLDEPVCHLTRVMPDTFGFGKPEANLLVGPKARILARPPSLDQEFGRERLLVPARDLADGVNVVEVTPPRPP